MPGPVASEASAPSSSKPTEENGGLRPMPPLAASRPPHAKKRVLVAIPCFNEELAISGLVLRARAHADEVVVVDDGSKDRTAEAARLAGALVLPHPKNLGKGAALRTAFRHASANGFHALVLLDGDGQHDPDEIPIVVAPVLREPNPADLSLGFRYGRRTQMPLHRRVGKRVLDYATSVTGGGAVTDSQCGFRAFGPRAIQELSARLQSQRFAVESETLSLANQLGLKTENIPVHCRYEGVDGSSEGPLSHGISVLNQIIVMLTMRRPLLTVGIPGLVSCLVAGWFLVRLFSVYSDTGIFVSSYALAAATLAILGGIMVATALMLNLLLLLRRSFPNSWG